MSLSAAESLPTTGLPGWAQQVAQILDYAAQEGMVVELTARPDTLTPAQAASRLGMSRATVTRRVHDGRITALRVGNRIRIPVREVERYRESLMIEMARLDQDGIEDDLNLG
ncbi:hypothetical protein GCM10023147_08630 [Tsukamurella soli]|uniref:Helix-turn-helix domain-containing protein n=1 Tax=Tsukamurella soli TaxID=644556 RepID=A0ABP8J6R1_9ACTN